MNIQGIFSDMTTLQIIGNVVSFAGAIVMILIGLIKEKKHILGAQCIQFGLMGSGNLMLGGISGGISNAVSIMRNLIVFVTKDLSLRMKVVFIVLQAVLTAVFDWGNPFGLLPFLATVIFTLFLDSKDARVIKLTIIAGEVLWIFYDLHNKNYASFIMDFITIITNIVGIIAVQVSEGRNGLDKQG